MFKRLLIANRGEIACRIINTAKRLNITTVAIYSDVDSEALYVQQADEALYLGPPPARESYLAIDKIIALAKEAKVDAIHPGYGFLAENAGFAFACEQAGIIFVGPKSAHMRVMGVKDQAKALAQKSGSPVLPGYQGSDQDPQHLLREAEKMHFPVLIKPVAGGGGKGMRVVERAEDFLQALAASQREAQGSFNNAQVLLEKYLLKPRHIEIQVLADQHGNTIYLFERDCSLQRRHQKVIEQAPAPDFSHTLREQMGEAALKIVRGLGYVGAGTVEFLLEDDEHFYFMEMNTRLQVEHGVTELITGIDLVEWQLRIAAGETLALSQAALKMQGVAIEARLYAEDPNENFLPATGEIVYLEWPHMPCRIDSGIIAGSEVSIYYDPMLAKILVQGETHAQAWEHMRQALQHVRIAGVKTNLNFLRQLSRDGVVIAGAVNTHFIDDHQHALCPAPVVTDLDCVIMAMAIALTQDHSLLDASPWAAHRAWRLNGPALQTIIFYQADTAYECVVTYGEKEYSVVYQGKAYLIKHATLTDALLCLDIAGQIYTRQMVWQDAHIWLLADEIDLIFTLPQTRSHDMHTLHENSLRAPMPGKVVQVMVQENEKVAAHQALMVLEAMKMEHTIHAPREGIVQAIHFQAGEQVQEGDELLQLDGAAN